MADDLRIHVDIDLTGRYAFRVQSATTEFTTAVDPEHETNLYEDLRLLRWKSIGVRNPGDALLSHVGDRLAGLIASPEQEQWYQLGLVNEARQVCVHFSQAAHHLMPSVGTSTGRLGQ